MSRISRLILPAFALLVVGLSAGGAKADPFLLGTVPLPPGGTVIPGAVTSTGAGSVVALTGPQSFSSGGVTGVLQTAVFREANGTLDFYYQLSNTGGTGITLTGLTAVDFTGVQTGVGFAPGVPSGLGGFGFVTGTDPPDTASRDLTGGMVTFSFATPLSISQTGDILVIGTDATSFVPTSVTVLLGGGGSISVNSFGPVGSPAAATPEPATLLLLATGLAGAAGAERRRRKMAG